MLISVIVFRLGLALLKFLFINPEVSFLYKSSTRSMKRRGKHVPIGRATEAKPQMNSGTISWLLTVQTIMFWALFLKPIPSLYKVIPPALVDMIRKPSCLCV